MTRLDELDSTENRVKTFEKELRDVKGSVERVHKDMKELKDESMIRKRTDDLVK